VYSKLLPYENITSSHGKSILMFWYL